MFSVRRYNPRYKSRNYYYKRKVNRKFSPAAYKNNPPTYYQQKGRIIQTSPLKLYEVPRLLPNTKTLEKMYNALIKANYPGIRSSSISPDFQINYSINNVPIQSIFKFASAEEATSIPIGHEFCQNILSNINNLPQPQEGYQWGIGLVSMLYDYDLQGVSNQAQFHLDYVNNWLNTSQLQLVIKSVSTIYPNGESNNILFMAPYFENYIRYSRVTFSSGSMTNQVSSTAAHNVIVEDTDFLTFISSFDEDNYLEITRDLNQSDINVPGKISMFFRVFQYPIQ